VVAETGLPNIMRWVPVHMDETELRNAIRNKMIRPTTIPSTLVELMVEQAISREALRLAFEQHKSLAVGLKGVQKQRTISDAFDQTSTGESLVDLMALEILVGSGGVLSHAPRRAQAAIMMVDAFQPQGVTMLAVDSIFMMPQLGVLATINEKAATDVFEKDCLIYLGSCVAVAGVVKPGTAVMKYKIQMPDGPLEGELMAGQIKLLPLGLNDTAEAELTPLRGLDLGEGPGKTRNTTLRGGVVGVILDGRGRPLALPEDDKERVKKLREWFTELKLYDHIPSE
jgi:hypothetical protein